MPQLFATNAAARLGTVTTFDPSMVASSVSVAGRRLSGTSRDRVGSGR